MVLQGLIWTVVATRPPKSAASSGASHCWTDRQTGNWFLCQRSAAHFRRPANKLSIRNCL